MEYFDAERFIKEIEKKPIIWNTNHPSYHSFEEKNKAWTEVANIMKPFCASEQSIESLKKKWKNLRDTYWKTVKATKKGELTGRIRRKYIYYDLLNFLVTEENSHMEEFVVNTEPHAIFRTSDTNEIKTEDSWHEEMSMMQTDTDNRSRRNMFDESSDDDPDRLFLLSLLPMLKSMNEKQNITFKIQSLKLVRNIKYESSNANDNFNNSSYSSKSTFSSSTPQAVPTSVSSSLE